MRVLLDLDDTVLINGRLHERFAEFQDWIARDNHDVTIWSSHDDAQAVAQLLGFNYVDKNAPEVPQADVLIDDCCEQFSSLCLVSELFSTLDAFLDAYAVP